MKLLQTDKLLFIVKKRKDDSTQKMMFKRSTNYSPIRVLILTAMKHMIQGRLEEEKNNLGNASSCYTEGIALKCKNGNLNGKLYFLRANIHQRLGEFT